MNVSVDSAVRKNSHEQVKIMRLIFLPFSQFQNHQKLRKPLVLFSSVVVFVLVWEAQKESSLEEKETVEVGENALEQVLGIYSRLEQMARFEGSLILQWNRLLLKTQNLQLLEDLLVYLKDLVPQLE